jgi:hypothetical protein
LPLTGTGNTNGAMLSATVLKRGSVSVIDYHRTSDADQPFPSATARLLSCVRRGAGVAHASFELVAGSVWSAIGDEFKCTHDHHRATGCPSARARLAEVVDDRTEPGGWHAYRQYQPWSSS